MNDSIRRLEEKIAYLERHVTEQDKAMLELVETIAALRRDLGKLRDERSTGVDRAGESDPRPPHY